MRAKRAFTFVELAVGLTLIGLILLVLANLLRLTNVFSRGVVSREGAQEAALLAIRKVADRIAEANSVSFPQHGKDTIPQMRSLLAYRTFEEELAFLFLDEKSGAVILRRAHLTQNGQFKILNDEVLWKSKAFTSLLFSTVRGQGGHKRVQIALEAGEDWYIDNITLWNAGR